MALLSQGYSFIAGLDEAGRGSLAGPVVAAAVILPLSDDCSMCLAGVRDSKQLTAQAREQLYEVIIQYALAVGVGIGPVELIDERNILQATKYAMRAALAQLAIPPQALLLDAINLPGIALPQRSIIKGDMLCLSIAAASIIADLPNIRATAPKPTWLPYTGMVPVPTIVEVLRQCESCSAFSTWRVRTVLN